MTSFVSHEKQQKSSPHYYHYCNPQDPTLQLAVHPGHDHTKESFEALCKDYDDIRKNGIIVHPQTYNNGSIRSRYGNYDHVRMVKTKQGIKFYTLHAPYKNTPYMEINPEGHTIINLPSLSDPDYGHKLNTLRYYTGLCFYNNPSKTIIGTKVQMPYSQTSIELKGKELTIDGPFKITQYDLVPLVKKKVKTIDKEKQQLIVKAVRKANKLFQGADALNGLRPLLIKGLNKISPDERLQNVTLKLNANKITTVLQDIINGNTTPQNLALMYLLTHHRRYTSTGWIYGGENLTINKLTEKPPLYTETYDLNCIRETLREMTGANAIEEQEWENA